MHQVQNHNRIQELSRIADISCINHMSNSVRIKEKGKILLSVFNLAIHFLKHTESNNSEKHTQEWVNSAKC